MRLTTQRTCEKLVRLRARQQAQPRGGPHLDGGHRRLQRWHRLQGRLEEGLQRGGTCFGVGRKRRQPRLQLLEVVVQQLELLFGAVDAELKGVDPAACAAGINDDRIAAQPAALVRPRVRVQAGRSGAGHEQGDQDDEAHLGGQEA